MTNQTKRTIPTPTSTSNPAPPVASTCCGGPAPAGSDACCVQDAAAKEAGEAGCGCDTPAAPARTTCCG